MLEKVRFHDQSLSFFKIFKRSYWGFFAGYFTHILIDEAAQCNECDVLIPLSLADKYTRIALAGDHMQLSPEIFSQIAREQQFQVNIENKFET